MMAKGMRGPGKADREVALVILAPPWPHFPLAEALGEMGDCLQVHTAKGLWVGMLDPGMSSRDLRAQATFWWCLETELTPPLLPSVQRPKNGVK